MCCVDEGCRLAGRTSVAAEINHHANVVHIVRCRRTTSTAASREGLTNECIDAYRCRFYEQLNILVVVFGERVIEFVGVLAFRNDDKKFSREADQLSGSRVRNHGYRLLRRATGESAAVLQHK